jgi:type II secretory pathway pseudopilin PulG
MKLKRDQQGITLLGLIVVGAILAGVILVGAQVLPTVIEYQAISKGAKKAAQEGGSVQQIRSSFDRAATIDQITSIKASDLDITKGADGTPVVSFSYDREIHLVGPAYLVMKYQGTTASNRRAVP